MANASRRLPHNAPGDFFVDSTCIDCDTCRWMAPATFTRREDSDLACRTKDEIVKDSFDYRSDVVFPNRPHAPVGVPGDVSVKPACPMHRYSVSWPRPARVG